MIAYVIIETETGLDAQCANSWVLGIELDKEFAQEVCDFLNDSSHKHRYIYFEEIEVGETLKYRK